MPDPSGINPLVGRVLPPPEMPSLDAALDTAGRNEQLQAFRKARIDAASDAAATQTALQQANGDPQAAIGHLMQSGKAQAAGQLQKAVDAHLTEVEKATDAHLKNQQAQASLISNMARGITDQHSLDAVKSIVAPEYRSYLGDTYDPARIQALQQSTMSAKDLADTQHQAHLDLIAAGADGEKQYQALLDGLGAIRDPQTWQSALQLAAMRPGADKARIAALPQTFSPEALKYVQDAAVSQENREKRPLLAAQTAEAQARAAAEPVKAQTELLKAQAAQKAAVPQLSPGAVQRAAAAFRLLGQQSIPTRIGEPDRVAIMNASDEQAKALGQSPVQTIQRQLALKADGPALALVRKQEAGTVASESKALKQIDLIKSISPTVARTDWPIINSGVLTFKEATGDTPTIKLQNAITTFASEYGKIIEGSTGSVAGASDSARNAATRLISAAQGKDTLNAVIDQMKTEMAYAKEGWGASADAILSRMGGGEGGAGAAASDAGKLAAGEKLAADGKTVLAKNAAGQWVAIR